MHGIFQDMLGPYIDKWVSWLRWPQPKPVDRGIVNLFHIIFAIVNVGRHIGGWALESVDVG